MARSTYIYVLVEHDFCDRTIHGTFTVKREALAVWDAVAARAEGTVYLERYRDGKLIPLEDLR